MTLELGTTDISTVKLGSTNIEKIYLGSTVVFSGAAPAGFSVVYTDSSDGDEAEFSFDLTGSGIAADDLCLIACIDRDGGATITVSGFTVGPRIDASNTNDSSLFYKTLAGTETTITSSGASGQNNITAILMVLRGVGYSSAETIELQTTGNINPPSATVTATDVVIEIGMYRNETAITPSTGYTAIVAEENTGGGAKTSIAAAYKEMTGAGTEDPGTMGGASGVDWAAMTIPLYAL